MFPVLSARVSIVAVIRSGHVITCRLTDLEEDLRDRSRTLAMVQVRSTFLEEENSRLQDRVESLTRDKQYLDRTLKDQQRERNREVRTGQEGRKEGNVLFNDALDTFLRSEM